MGKIIKLPFSKTQEKTYEECVICKRKTSIRRDENIQQRSGYVEGVGQLCYDCYRSLNQPSSD